MKKYSRTAIGAGHREMSNIECGYLAGVLDSEGYIGIQNCGRQIRVGVTMTNREVMGWILKTTGVGYLAARVAEPLRNKVSCFEWRCFSTDASRLLRTVEPFLIGKKAQAMIALKLATFLECRSDPCANITAAEADFGRQCGEMIKALNSQRQNGYQLNRRKIKSTIHALEAVVQG